jgi:hypothetical protein
MDIFLDAECVITALEKDSVISMVDWKHTHPEVKKYSACFPHAETNGVIIFEITKVNNRFCIAKLRVNIIARRYRFNADKIYDKCSI